MRSTNLSVPATKPRNRILRALLNRTMGVGAGRHKRAPEKRQSNADHRDLAQRVRESGEW